LDQIEVLVLLDLLGVTNTRFPNYYRTTSWLFYKLMSLETRLRRQSLFKEISEKTGERLESLFHPDSMLTFRGESIADDHVPFLMRGVNVLHLIPYPFPYVWHTRAVREREREIM
jgi:glutaminyl-peptide cyclotransferase